MNERLGDGAFGCHFPANGTAKGAMGGQCAQCGWAGRGEGLRPGATERTA